MKALLQFVSITLLLSVCPDLHAAVPAGKTQQLTAPDKVPEGLAKSDWSSIREAYEAARHVFHAIEGGWQARNPGQQWLTTFDGRGFVTEPAGGGWLWGLELLSYGFPGTERVVGAAQAVKAEGQRLTYTADAAVEEWFVNDARGLEHGFTVHTRPEANATPSGESSPLSFWIAVRRGLHPSVASDAQGVEFRDGTGATVLNYTGLKVWAADGKTLLAHFTPVVAGSVLSRGLFPSS